MGEDAERLKESDMQTSDRRAFRAEEVTSAKGPGRERV